MRILSSILLATSTLPALAQEAPKPAAPKTEIAFNAGFALGEVRFSNALNAYPRGAVSLLRNFNRFQFGLTVEAGGNAIQQGCLTPGALANYRISGAGGYFYGGAMLGYTKTDVFSSFSPANGPGISGFVLGLQTGYVRPVGKRFALTTELAVRRCHFSNPESGGQFYSPDHRNVLYVPATLGIRYRF